MYIFERQFVLMGVFVVLVVFGGCKKKVSDEVLVVSVVASNIEKLLFLEVEVIQFLFKDMVVVGVVEGFEFLSK